MFGPSSLGRTCSRSRGRGLGARLDLDDLALDFLNLLLNLLNLALLSLTATVSQNSASDKTVSSGTDSHFLSYELQPSVHRPFYLDLVLLEKDRTD